MMKYVIRGIIFTVFFILYIEVTALANIAPLKVNPDGVEPLDNPGVKIQSAEITVIPEENGFRFNCNYILVGLRDDDSITVGIPGDKGYTLEAGYIESMNVVINGKPVKHETYDTTENLSQKWRDYNLPLNFKWHTFSVPVKKNIAVNVSVTYNISWKILEEDSQSPYYIVPILLSMDKLFSENIDSYKIKYVNDDLISIPDVKVMMNFLLEPNIISEALISPTWGPKEISWEFKDSKDFQDFRLIVLSFRKLAMNFSTKTEVDNSIRLAAINENFSSLASIFEDIATKKIETGLDDETLGTASYMACEFYFRLGNYQKALEMLALPQKTNLWPAAIKYQYINAVMLKDEQKHEELVEELNHLVNYSDFILVSKFAKNEMETAIDMAALQDQKESPKDAPLLEEKDQEDVDKKDNTTVIFALCTSVLALGAIGYGLYLYKYKKRNS